MKIFNKVICVVIFTSIIIALCACGDTPAVKPSPTGSALVTPSPEAIGRTKNSSTDKQDFNADLGKEDNNQWNINRGGFIARSGDSYYYADDKMGILYKVKIDGTARTKIDNDPNVENINIVDGWIYYTVNYYNWPEKRENDVKAFKDSAKIVKLSVENGQKVVSNFHGDTIIVDKSYVYFTNIRDNNKLYKCDLSFKKATKVADEKEISNLYVANDFIYYLAAEGIFKIKNDGSQKTLEVQSPGISNFTIENGNIYFLTKGSGYFYSVSVDKPSERKLLLNKVTDFYVKAEYIYFKQENGELKKAKGDNISATIENAITNIGKFTMIGNVLFCASKDEDSVKVHGYMDKYRIDKTRVTTPLSKDNREVKIGLNQYEIQDYVALNIDIEDRNKINLNIMNNLNDYFQGNSVPIFRQLIDIDNDKLNDQFIIYKQYVTEVSTAISGVENNNGWQCVLLLLKWNGNKLEILGPLPLKSSAKLITGTILKPIVKLMDVEKGGYQEVVLDMGLKKIANLELFKVYPTHLEAMDARPFHKYFESVGYTIY